MSARKYREFANYHQSQFLDGIDCVNEVAEIREKYYKGVVTTSVVTNVLSVTVLGVAGVVYNEYGSIMSMVAVGFGAISVALGAIDLPNVKKNYDRYKYYKDLRNKLNETKAEYIDYLKNK